MSVFVSPMPETQETGRVGGKETDGGGDHFW